MCVGAGLLHSLLLPGSRSGRFCLFCLGPALRLGCSVLQCGGLHRIHVGELAVVDSGGGRLRGCDLWTAFVIWPLDG